MSASVLRSTTGVVYTPYLYTGFYPTSSITGDGMVVGRHVCGRGRYVCLERYTSSPSLETKVLFDREVNRSLRLGTNNIWWVQLRQRRTVINQNLTCARGEDRLPYISLQVTPKISSLEDRGFYSHNSLLTGEKIGKKEEYYDSTSSLRTSTLVLVLEFSQCSVTSRGR